MSRLALLVIALAFGLVSLAPAQEAAARVFAPSGTEVSALAQTAAAEQPKKKKKKTAGKKKKSTQA
ncbi:MAG: hypothetical protein EXQ87_06600 [Alphaproteobacteria bacterium]|nr:hypothetical protein [Alphaproteobacteria bacterium]